MELLEELEGFFTRSLGRDVRMVVVRTPADPHRLSRPEQLSASLIRSPERQAQWLRGRAALRAVMMRMSRFPQTGSLRFPHPELSLTHTGDVAIAVGIDGAEGIGIDLETKTPSDRAARRFLSPRELGGDARRLWTVKEACFKADLDNAGVTVSEFLIDDPASPVGRARRGDRAFLYASTEAFHGWLTVAIRST